MLSDSVAIVFWLTQVYYEIDRVNGLAHACHHHLPFPQGACAMYFSEGLKGLAVKTIATEPGP